MKKIILFLLPVLVFACSEKSSDKTAIVCGKITDPTGEFVIVTLNEKNDTAKINEDGTFYMEIDIEGPHYGLIRSGEYSNIFLSPGDSVYVEIDTKEFDETIKYSGTGAEINNYLAKKLLIETGITSSPVELYTSDEKSFAKKVDSLKQSITQLYDKVSVKNKVFQKFEPKNIEYLAATLLVRYPLYHRHYAKDESYEKSESFWDFLDTIEIENAEYWELANYKNFFNAYYSEQTMEILNSDVELQKNQDASAHTYAQFIFIKTKMTDPKLKSIKAGDAMYSHVMYYNTDSIDDLMSDFLTLCTDSAKISQEQTIIEKKKKLAKGMPAPDFETVDVDNNPVNLSDFKGKYVYVDFWASWCGPCRQEIPHFKTLTSDFIDKNIVFLSVSVDAKKDEWEKAIVNHDMTGNLLYIGSGSKIIKDEYMVYSIPRFVLIDPEGNFVDSNAPRPSSEEIRSLFSELI